MDILPELMVPSTALLGACKNLCERSLYEFVQHFWHVVEPAAEFVEGKVLEVICDHLEAVTYGDFRKLIINVPPGCSKSLITSVFWPAWMWGPVNRPSMRFINASYSVYLTERDNERCARIMTSPEYQRYWGDRVKLSKIGVGKIQTNHTGWKFATSVEGTTTGERGDFIIIDDANNPKKSESKAIRDATNLWLTEVVPTRLNNPRKSAIVNIQQRTHEEDATGTLLKFWEDCTHLMLPMRYDPNRHCETEIGFSDWRTEEGELLWEARFPETAVRELERMGPYAVSSQLQQSPVPRGGGIIQRDWWQEWPHRESPPVEFVVASLDTAIKEKEENDYYALTVWAVWLDPDTETPKLLMLNAWKERATLAEIVTRTVNTCKALRVDRLVIEDKANGWVAQQEIRKAIKSSGHKFGITMFDPRRYGDKMARLLSVQHLFSEGLVYAPVTIDPAGNTNWREWAEMAIDEIANFPRAAHDDITDSTSMALRHLRDIGFALSKVEHSRAAESDMAHRSKSEPLYPV
ncbi:phage terminase large subunit [Acidisoma cellulosilytica]|uniref:Phage terminase large subunit n=1 Tax=Acidisoma cellulosilyticum TaxID=2802395 RepID=A0A963Z1G6_9PROT|nr:phage terminase large subunit [Acidisoma cellulosilyticum]MCB8880115.1 phage terminase large subunit [Acidisoma cellulosilyticum]